MKDGIAMKRIEQVEKIIGYTFQKKAWLKEALTHSSYGRDQKRPVQNYERLEFLGDAVLELCTSKRLFDEYDWTEGKLTKMRASIVCEASLSKLATSLSIGDYIIMSHGEEKSGGRQRKSILCDVVEALIGAVYQDGGMKAAQDLVERLIFSHLDELVAKPQEDYKSHLQELLQGMGLEKPEYVPVSTEGPPHDRIFTIELKVNGHSVCQGTGKSKKAAEQYAAAEALQLHQEKKLL